MKKILAKDRDDFAMATDDYNSVHFGPDGIAHGCHTLAWAIGQVVKDGDIISALDVRFNRPVPIGSVLDEPVVKDEGNRLQVTVFMGTEMVLMFRMWRKGRAQAPRD